MYSLKGQYCKEQGGLLAKFQQCAHIIFQLGDLVMYIMFFFVSLGTGDNEGDETQERRGDVRRL